MDISKNRLFKTCSAIAFILLLMSCSYPLQAGTSLVTKTVNYCESSSNQWSGWSECAIPIFLSGDEIIFGTVPKGVFKIIEKFDRKSEDKRGIVCKCRNSRGTVFMVNLQFSSGSDALMKVESDKVKIKYECSISNKKPYCNMVDLGLSCKWGLTNYYNYSTDIVSATYGAGKRMTYDEAYVLFGTGEQHLPTTSQINELLIRDCRKMLKIS